MEARRDLAAGDHTSLAIAAADEGLARLALRQSKQVMRLANHNPQPAAFDESAFSPRAQSAAYRMESRTRHLGEILACDREVDQYPVFGPASSLRSQSYKRMRYATLNVFRRELSDPRMQLLQMPRDGVQGVHRQRWMPPCQVIPMRRTPHQSTALHCGHCRAWIVRTPQCLRHSEEFPWMNNARDDLLSLRRHLCDL